MTWDRDIGLVSVVDQEGNNKAECLDFALHA